MRKSVRSTVIGVVAIGLLAACGVDHERRSSGETTSPAGDALAVSVNVVHRDDRSGLPTFAWLDAGTAKGSLRGLSPREAAQVTLRGIARAYGLRDEVVASSAIQSIHDVGSGPIIARFTQHIGGVEIFQGSLNIAFTREMEPLAASGALSRVSRKEDRLPFAHDAKFAVANAARTAGVRIDERDIQSGRSVAGYETFRLAGNMGDRREVAPTRAKKVWFDGDKGLHPAYYVELHLGTDAHDEAELKSFVVSAVDGKVLFTNVMTAADAYTYRVFAEPAGTPRAFFPYIGPQGYAGIPHPTGVPDKFQAPFVPSNLVTLQNLPFSQNDPWLPPGATTTTGNNVDAYANLYNDPGVEKNPKLEGFDQGDLRTTVTAPNTFDFAYDHDVLPGANETNVQAATTQLFYTVNFMHDWFYDVGWDEASLNPQSDNFGRGGTGGDPILAQAQDVSGRNNANASTPADGASPRIRMYIFDGNAVRRLIVNGANPAEYKVNVPSFGPKDFLTTGVVALAAPADACTAITNPGDIAGKIALVDRGTCSAIVKINNAQAAGAIGVLVVNNQPGLAPGFVAGPEVDPATIVIPTLTLSQDDGAKIKAGVAAGPLEVTLRRDVAIDRDGSLDAAIVSHEWGHILSNRLVGNGNGLSTTQARGMGEGWSDFVGLLTYTRPENVTAPTNPNWSGVFPLAAYTTSGGENEGYYYGIRRVPYSVDFNKNPLTFKHVSNGVPLPATAPFAYGQDGKNNAEVHATGEVWATMLWECYVSLLRDPRYTFEQANLRMRQYLVASLKLTPNAPTILEARDAVLAAAYATDKQDFQGFASAFARRGAGVGAVAPPRLSTTNVGAEESFLTGADVQIVSAKVEGTVSECNPYGILRNGEKGKLTVVLKNVGTAPLLGTTMALSSTGNQITFPNGALVNVPVLKPFASTTQVLDVEMQGAPFASSIDTTVDVTDPDLAQPRTVSLTYPADYNYDVALNSAVTDGFDTPADVFTVMSDQALDLASPWKRVPEGNKFRWSVIGVPTTSDHSLVTPDFVVDPAKPFTFTFEHRYSFESDAKTGKNFDGGVIELSVDKGATWTDIGALASPGYGGLLEFEDSTNPLKMRTAFVGVSAQYPAYVTSTVNLGAAFGGSTVRIRFRAATDNGVGAPGWDIARVTADGIKNTPFPSRVPVAACGVEPGPNGGQNAQNPPGGQNAGPGNPMLLAHAGTRVSRRLHMLLGR